MTSGDTGRTGPLDGVRVVELCGDLGQLAGKLLADMGADVIKVEPPGGSSARTIGPFVKDIPGPNRSLNFWYHNTNKRSIVLDFEANELDAGILRNLIGGADIFLEDTEPGTLEAIGLGHESLRAGHPGLIHCALTPFGQSGPWAHYQVSDLVALAAGGPMRMNGYNEEDVAGAPPIHGQGDQAYNTACHFATIGMLVALFHRDVTGEGQYIDCSMHEALSCTTEVGMPYWFYKRVNVMRQTGRHAAAVRTERWLYRGSDGRGVLMFGIGRDNATWQKIKEWFQSEGFGLQFDEARFDSAAARQPGRGSAEASEIVEEARKFFEAHEAAYSYRGGQERGQSWGVVYSPDETLSDPHWHDRGFFVGTTGEGVESPALMPGAPYIFNTTAWRLRRPAPKLGEHTAEILTELM